MDRSLYNSKIVKKIEDTLQQLTKLQEIISYIPANLYWKDRRGIYLGYSKSAANAIDMTPNEIIGKCIYDILDKKTADMITKNDELVMGNNRELTFEEEYTNKNGKTFLYISKKIPLHDTSGKVNGLLGISMDITDINLYLSNIKKENERNTIYLESILANSPGHIYWMDKEGKIIGCNNQQANYFGLQRKDLIGKNIYDVAKILDWPTEIPHEIRRNDLEVMRTKKTKIIEEKVHKNGKEMYFWSTKSILESKNGEIIGILGIATDITKRKKAESEAIAAKNKAELANKSKTQFIANMSHDIRTPITGILALAQDMINTTNDAILLAQKKLSNENFSLLNTISKSVSENSQLLIGAADELLQTCNEILEVTCLESGKSKETTESFDLNELLTHNDELLQPLARHKELDLSYSIDASVPQYLYGIRTYLDRSLLNLTSNALKFTESGFVKITVNLSEDKNYQAGDPITLQILVEDTGIGIPKDKFDAIFEHFSRLNSSYDGIYKGAGLGLYTVKRYIEAMDGEIDVDSNVGQGTCFTLTLPFTVSDHADRTKVSVRPQKMVAHIPSENADALLAKKLSTQQNITGYILVVEDNTLAAMAVKLALQPFQCAMDIAKNGSEAVTMASTGSYDLILIDIGLPDFSGVEVTKKIRALKDTQKSQVPIVALTGHANNPEMRQEALDAGMQAMLSKPAQPLALESVLQDYVFKIKTNKQSTHQQLTLSYETPGFLAIIDWDACVQMCGDDHDFTRKMLSMLAKDLHQTKTVLAKAYANHDTRTLRDELHRALGGVCYLKVPQLEHTLKAFHHAVKAEPQDKKVLAATYAALQDAIHAFWKTWESDNFN